MNDVLKQAPDQTPGQILKAEREIREIDLEEVAQRLLLSKNTIIAIEEDDYSKISAQVYAEGYLKAYAKFLQIPTDMVLESFRHLNVYPGIEIKTETKTQTRAQNQTSRWKELPKILKGQRRGHVFLYAFTVLILGILVIFVSKYFFGKSSEIIHVPNNSSNVTIENDNNKVASDSDAADSSISSEIMALPDQNKVSDKTLKNNRGFTADNNESNLILTKPKAE